MKKFFIIILVVVALTASVFSEDIISKKLLYLDKTGKESNMYKLQLNKSQVEVNINYSSEKESFNILNDSLYRTYFLKYTAKNTDLTAKRVENKILVKGIVNNKTIEKEIKIDNADWFQAMEFSLIKLFENNLKSYYFWIMDPKGDNAYKLVAYNEGTDKISVNNKTIDAYKVRVTLASFPGFAINGYFWFRKSDMVYVKCKAVKGFIGTPESNVEMVEEIN